MVQTFLIKVLLIWRYKEYKFYRQKIKVKMNKRCKNYKNPVAKDRTSLKIIVLCCALHSYLHLGIENSEIHSLSSSEAHVGFCVQN
jgi:hypothetical protein